MSLHLLCPNCSRPIGHASNEDGYVHHFDHKDDKGNLICPTCGTGSNMLNGVLAMLLFATVVAVALTAMF